MNQKEMKQARKQNRKRRKQQREAGGMPKGAWIGAVAAVVLIGGGIGAWSLWNFVGEKPEEALTKYMSYIEKQDYEAMYGMLTAESKETISKEDFITRNKNIYEGIEAEQLKLQVKETEGRKEHVAYTVTMQTIAGEIAFDHQAELVKEDRAWHLEWTDQLIFPQLDAEEKIRITTLDAERGNIYDRSGTLLAGKGVVTSVGFIPGKMSENPTADIQKAAELLGVTADIIQDKLHASWVTEETFVPIKKLKQETQDQSDGQTSDPLIEALLTIPGIMVSDEESRVYPFGEAASHLTGYAQGISAEELEEAKGKGYSAHSLIGKSGLEKLYEEQLHGRDGAKISIIDASGAETEVIAMQLQDNGKDVYTTIDAKLQQDIYVQFQDERSASVAMNPVTGEVLALVSTPSYDSNDFILGMSNELWDALNEDTNKPLYNRFREAWCPGSSFKPVVAAIGLSNGLLTAEENFGHTGVSWQKDETWGSYFITTTRDYGDQVVLRNALVYSDNIYFAKAALKMGESVLAEQLEKIGFEEEMPFEIGMNSSQYANEGTFESEIQLADTGYGQGQLLVNPLHLASIYSAFLNQGNMIQPYLERQEERQPTYWKEQVFTAEAAHTVTEDLKAVIEQPDGTGHGAYTEGLSLAGKTGTAELKATQEETDGMELGWFSVYTTDTAADQSVLLINMVEDVKDRGGSNLPVEKDRVILSGYFNP